MRRAREGSYSQFEVQRGLSKEQIQRYFRPTGDMWQLRDEIKSRVRFKHFNLLNPYESLGQFDIIFCRNVLIYFDQQTKSEVLARIAKSMPPDGVLYLGGAETVLGITDKFVPIAGHRGIYGLAGGMPALKSA